MTDRETQALIAEIQAIPKPQRVAYLADLPEARQRALKRILGADDIRKLNDEITRRKTVRPKLQSRDEWLADARAGRASSIDAMIEVLREVREKLRPNDAQWVSRIDETAKGRSFSRKQKAVIEGIYKRYFDQSEPTDRDV